MSRIKVSHILVWTWMFSAGMGHAGTVSGRVTRSDTGEGVGGVQICLEASLIGDPFTLETDGGGYYNGTVPYSSYMGYNTYSLTPLLPGYLFRPEHITELNPAADHSGMDFIGSPPVRLSGRVTRADSGMGMDGIEMSWGTNILATTNGGQFDFTVSYGSSGVLAVTEANGLYPGDFNPMDYTFLGVTQSYEELNFEYDRQVEWSTYLGGAGASSVAGATADAMGNLYVVGTTDADGWISGGFQTERAGGRDAFVTKLDPQGQPVWSTYLGGTNHEAGTAIEVTPDGAVVVAGTTYSSNWVSGGVIVNKSGSSSTENGFLVRLDASGQHEWSTYLGTTEVDGLAITEDGTIVATGWAGASPTNDGTYTGWWNRRVAGGYPGNSGSRPGNALWMEVAGNGQQLFFSTDLGYRGYDMAQADGSRLVMSEASAGPLVRKYEGGLGYLQLDWPTNGLSRYWWQGGGGWRVAGGTNWLSTGEGLVMPAGTYTLEFKESTRMRPDPMEVTVERGQIHRIELAYGDKPLNNFPTGWSEGLVMGTGGKYGDAYFNSTYEAYGGNLSPVLLYAGVLGDGESGIVDLHLVGNDFLKFDGTGSQNGVTLSPMISCIDNLFFPSNEVPDRYVSSWYTNQYYWRPCSLESGWTVMGGGRLTGDLEPAEVGASAQWRVVADNGTNMLITGWFTNHHELASCAGDVQIECKTVGGTTNTGWLAPMDGLTYTKITNFPVNYEWQTVFEDVEATPKSVSACPDGRVMVLGVLDAGDQPWMAVLDGETGTVLSQNVLNLPVGVEQEVQGMDASSQTGTNTLLLSGTTSDTGWLGGPTNWTGAYLAWLDDAGNWMGGRVVHPQGEGQYVVETTPGTFVVVGTTSYSNGAWNVAGAVYPGGHSAIFATQVELWTPPPPERPVLGEGQAGEVEGPAVDSRPQQKVQCPICPPATSGDPVDMAKGHFMLEVVDWESDGGLPIRFARHFHSGVDYLGSLGWRWTHEYDRRLFRREDGGMVIRENDGDLTKYEREGEDIYRAEAGRSGILRHGENGMWRQEDGKGAYQEYDEAGRIRRIGDFQGNALVLSYADAEPRTLQSVAPYSLMMTNVAVSRVYMLSRIDQVIAGFTNGASVELRYGTDGFLTNAMFRSAPGAPALTATYQVTGDGTKDLAEVISTSGKIFPYTYDEQHRIETFYPDDCACSIVANTYDEMGRVIRQERDGQETVFDYYPADAEVRATTRVVSREDGTWIRDRVEYFQFNSNGLTTNYVLQLGGCRDSEAGCAESDDLVTAYHYDETGLVLTGQEDIGAAALDVEYDEYSRPTRSCMSNSVNGEVICSHAGYDAVGNCTNRYVTSTFFAGIRFDERVMEYDAQNRLVQLVRIGTNGQTLGTAYAHGTNETGSWTITTWPDGTRSRSVYDLNSRLIRQDDPDDPGNSIQYFRDMAGNCTQVVNKAGQMYQHGYDGEGRQIWSRNPLGQETIWTYRDGKLVRQEVGRRQGIPGRTQSFNYDQYGNLTQVWRVEANGASNLERRLVYDSAGLPIREEDAAGMVSRYQYDGAGRQIAIQDVYGNWRSNVYWTAGKAEVHYDAMGVGTLYQYDVFGRLTNVVEALGTDEETHERYSYNPLGTMLSKEDAEDTATQYEYDSFGRLARITGAADDVRYVYDAMDRVVAKTDGRGITTTNLYDRLGRITGARDSSGVMLYSNRYDAAGQLVATTDGNGNTTWLMYDALGRCVAESAPNDSGTTVRAWAYNPWGEVELATNAVGGWNRMFYDEAGRLTNVAYSTGAEIKMEYDSIGNLVAMVYPDGSVQSNAWQGGRLTAKNSRQGYSQHISYTADNRMAAVRDGIGIVKTMSYDRKGRLLVESNQYGEATSYQYNGQGQTCAKADAFGEAQVYDYDGKGRMTNSQGRLEYSVGYQYDAAGNPIRVQYQTGYLARSYDLRNRVQFLAFPDGTEWEYGYDNAGNLTRVRTASGIVRSHEYNAQNRPVALDTSSGYWQTAEYDLLGRVVRLEDSLSTNVYAYSADGPVATSRQARCGAILSYGYDAEWRPRSMSYGSYSVHYEYSSKGQLNSLSNWAGIFTYRWNTNLYAVDGVQYPGGMVLSNRYDTTGRLSQRKYSDAAGNVIRSYAFQYDLNGRCTNRIDETGGGWRYMYDSYGQLTGAVAFDSAGNAIMDRSYSYAFDPAGNMVRMENGGDVWTYGYDAMNQMTSIWLNGSSTVIQHDLDGNMVDDGSRQYAWNSLGQLVGVQMTTGQVEHLYDVRGFPIERRWNDHGVVSSTRFVYDQNCILAELNETNGLERLYTRGLDVSGSLQGAGGAGGLLAMTENGVHYFYLDDGFGNVIGLVDQDFNLVATYEYEPFGECLDAGDSLSGQPFRYSSKYADIKTGLLNFGYRHYSPALRRWISRDPLLESGGSINVQSYCLNDPVNIDDPFGLACYFFDGTNNDKDNAEKGRPTNVAIMHDLYEKQRCYRNGVGTGEGMDYVMGGFSGLGARYRLEKMWDALVENFKRGDTDIDCIIGFSRGAAMAREFANMIAERGNPLEYRRKGQAIQKWVDDGEWTRLQTIYPPHISGNAPHIKFLGIYDTVGSMGMPGDTIDLGYRMWIPDNVRHVAHAVSQDERRDLFDLTSVLKGPGWVDPTGRIIEQVFPGVHSDIGGGYNENLASLQPLLWMLAEARKAGVNSFGSLPVDKYFNTEAGLVYHDSKLVGEHTVVTHLERNTHRLVSYPQNWSDRKKCTKAGWCPYLSNNYKTFHGW